ncbi:3-keto-5-aminohexanoate cleavage protein [Nonomuraea lactucae]|uniref:3-keto-5-aminohexanoate cleavage protein n=1 Tax=Nonomuraea lactucae TaxID=2249762 RepID=UPI0013B37873|nr:3-keto-5-aminohexanoate cleavage protein [Nonomuraea lactucae]
MHKKLILEIRANEYAMRDGNPHVPWTPEELGAEADACRAAGATIFHFHPRTPQGAPGLSYDTYHAVMNRIRAGSDILVHATLGAEQQTPDSSVRLDPIRKLTEDGLRPDFAPLDMGSSNLDLLTEDGTDFATTETVYINTTRTLRFFAESLRDLGVKPYPTIWNASQLRLTDVFHRMKILDGPVWASLTMSEGPAFCSHPGSLAGLNAYLSLIPDSLPIEWSALVYGGSLLKLAPEVIARGGHLAIGIGDYAYPEEGAPTNAELAERVVAMAKDIMGREVATPDEAREMLGMS